MVTVAHGRRAFVEALVGVPFAAVALAAQTSSPSVGKVAAGAGRADDIIAAATAFTSRSRPRRAVARCS